MSSKNKILYLCVLPTLSLGFFFLGWYLHKTNVIVAPTIAEEAPNMFDFNQTRPYIPLTAEACPFMDGATNHMCIASLADSTMAEANELAEKMIEALPQQNSEGETADYHNFLHDRLQLVQTTKDDHINVFCSLDMMRFFGGTIIGSEIGACRYFYGKQYLELLRAIERKTFTLSTAP